jgi:hypothetical protein
MARRLLKYRIGPGPNWTYLWVDAADPIPANADAVIDIVEENASEIKHYAASNGHYRIEGVTFDVPAATITRKNIYTVPDLTRGVDVMDGLLYPDPANDGDRLVGAKALIGQIAAVISANVGAKTVTLRSLIGILKPSSLGGKIDEGFHLSFGAETFSEIAPLEDFMVKRIGAATPVGDGTNEDVTITLDTFPGVAPAPGAVCNLAVPFIGSPIEFKGGGGIDIGKETTTGRPLPAGRVIQVAYERVAATPGKVCGYLVLLY